MPALSIFRNAEEMGRGIPEDKIVDCTGLEMRIGLLRHGMQSGGSSISMFFQLPDGRYGFFQTSAALFQQAAQLFEAVKTVPAVPVKPEPLARLRARYASAVAIPFDLRKLEGIIPPGGRPGDRPEHVFDTEEGVRLIISRETMPDGRDSIHLSGSIHESDAGTTIELQCRATGTPAPAFDTVVWTKFCEISGVDAETKPIMFARSPGKGLPHFIIPYQAPPA